MNGLVGTKAKDARSKNSLNPNYGFFVIYVPIGLHHEQVNNVFYANKTLHNKNDIAGNTKT